MCQLARSALIKVHFIIDWFKGERRGGKEAGMPGQGVFGKGKVNRSCKEKSLF